ncbi:MAG: SpoIIE family protein phosphatase [Tepidisphaeraceae bacterium]|jgi:serine phosphatase RsbU (regulator of sigma subunit)
MSQPQAKSAWLVPLPGGPPLSQVELRVKPGGVVVGRHELCDAPLPADAEQVSRQHARFTLEDDVWRVVDLGSRWGTFVNGVRLAPQRAIPLNDADLIRIVPWTFSFNLGTSAPRRALLSVDDHESTVTMIHTIAPSQSGPLQDEMVNLLLESATAIHGAPDEKTLANVLMDIACRGTGLPHAAVLRALDSAGRIEVLARRVGPALKEATGAVYSRTLLATASTGVVAELSAATSESGSASQSILELQIDAAICVPLMLGTTVAAYLYLDSRSGAEVPRKLRSNAAAFCLALAKMAGLALANLKRMDVERRAAIIEAELHAGAAAQKWILPRGPTQCENLVCVGTSRPGAYLGGDFFDALVLPDGKVAVSLGDVSGHGVAASVLMTAAQGFLHAALLIHGDVARAVSDLNEFLLPRRPEGKFVTLWSGVFDTKAMTVHYVDAGHGYALLAKPTGQFEQLRHGDGLPVGIMPETRYVPATAKISPGERVLIISDGIAEQFESEQASGPGGMRNQFEISGVQKAMAAARGETEEQAVARIFQALFQFAGTENLSDDATVVLVSW